MMAYNFNPYQQLYPNNQIQNGGFVSVRSIQEAFNWPVAPGNSITFKDENAPFVYTKTKGISPFEQPIFEKYRLVKEEDVPTAPQAAPEPQEQDKQIKLLWDEVNALKASLNALEGKHDQSADD